MAHEMEHSHLPHDFIFPVMQPDALIYNQEDGNNEDSLKSDSCYIESKHQCSEINNSESIHMKISQYTLGKDTLTQENEIAMIDGDKHAFLPYLIEERKPYSGSKAEFIYPCIVSKGQCESCLMESTKNIPKYTVTDKANKTTSILNNTHSQNFNIKDNVCKMLKYDTVFMIEELNKDKVSCKIEKHTKRNCIPYLCPLEMKGAGFYHMLPEFAQNENCEPWSPKYDDKTHITPYSQTSYEPNTKKLPMAECDLSETTPKIFEHMSDVELLLLSAQSEEIEENILHTKHESSVNMKFRHEASFPSVDSSALSVLKKELNQEESHVGWQEAFKNNDNLEQLHSNLIESAAESYYSNNVSNNSIIADEKSDSEDDQVYFQDKGSGYSSSQDSLGEYFPIEDYIDEYDQPEDLSIKSESNSTLLMSNQTTKTDWYKLKYPKKVFPNFTFCYIQKSLSSKMDETFSNVSDKKEFFAKFGSTLQGSDDEEWDYTGFPSSYYSTYETEISSQE